MTDLHVVSFAGQLGGVAAMLQCILWPAGARTRNGQWRIFAGSAIAAIAGVVVGDIAMTAFFGFVAVLEAWVLAHGH